MGNSKKENAIILGAGAPHRGDTPSVLWDTGSGKLILNWILDALNFPYLNINFVAGYKADKIINNFPNINFSLNEKWESMGSTGSLLSQELDVSKPLLISYGDILFRKNLIGQVIKSSKPIALVWDSRFFNDYSKKRNKLKLYEKIKVINKRVLRIGTDLSNTNCNGIFIGIVRFQPEVLKEIKKFEKEIISSLMSGHISCLIEFLRLKGYEVEAIDVNGDWTELIDSNDIATFILGSKAKTLKRLQKMVSLSKIKDQISFSQEEWEKDDDRIINSILNLFGKQKKLIIRSSSQNEDGFNFVNAGKYKSILNVLPEKLDIRNAINEVIASFGKDVSKYDEVLIQLMIDEVIYSGVAFTRTLGNGSPWYVINYEEGKDTTAITSGKSKDHKTCIIKRNLDTFIKKPLWIQKLLESIEEVESLLAYDSLDIEFAINKKNEVYILQVRPLNQSDEKKYQDKDYQEKHQKTHIIWEKLNNCPPHIPGKASSAYGLMPDWNPAEIIGTSPGELALSLYKYLITNDTWAQQRADFGYRDVRPSPLVVSFLGKPYVDLRLSFCSFIPKNISDHLAGKLLNFYLKFLKENRQYHDKVEFNIIPTCFTTNFKNWAKILKEKGGLDKTEIDELKNELVLITKNSFSKPKIYLKSIEELKRKNLEVLKSDLDHLDKARILIEDCKRIGTLPFAHLARCAFISVALLNDAVASNIISKSAKDSFFGTIRSISHDFTNDGHAVLKGKLEWEVFVSKYGHLRPGTYEISSSRYDSDTNFFLRNSININKNNELKISLKAWEKEKKNFFEALKSINLPSEVGIVEEFLYNSIEGREYAKFVFTKNLSDALEEIVLAFEEFNLNRNELSHLDLLTLLNIRESTLTKSEITKSLKNQVALNKKNKEIQSHCLLPPLIFEEKELDMFFVNSSTPNFIGSKIVACEFIEIDEQMSIKELNLEGKIAIIKRADPGYDWLFTQDISGLITLYGGANSHMAIRSAEFNITASIGVGEKIYSQLLTSKIIEINPINQTIKGL